MFLDNEINSNIRNNKTDTNNISNNKKNNNGTKFGVMIQQNIMFSETPPPLPPRIPLPSSSGNNTDTDAVNSINKQMSYPLVATCATLVNNYVSNQIY